MTKEQFQKSAWYRLLQVIFIGSFSFAIILTYGIFDANKPQKSISNEKSSITCISGENTGKTYSIGKNGMYLLGSGEFLDSDNETARNICAYNKKYVPVADRLPGRLPNYRIDIAYDTYSSWEEAFGYSTLYALGVIIGFWLIKRLIFFIAFGESIFRKPNKLFD